MHHLFWTSGHNGGVVAVPRCNFSIDCRIPACLSLIRHTSGRAATTRTFTRSRNQYQLSKFSFSTNANASGTIWLLQSTPICGEYLTFIPSSQKYAINADYRKTTLKCSNTSTYAKEDSLQN